VTILDEDLINTNLKDNEFDSRFAKLRHKYLHRVYSNYLYFSIENTKTKQRLAFNTNPTWYQNYIDLKLIDHCPLYAATSHICKSSRQGTSFFLWNQIIPEDRSQRNVVGLRGEHNIANGLSFSMKVRDYLLILGLGADLKDHELEMKYKNIMPSIYALFCEAQFICFSEFKRVCDAI
jgi:hypothetical protein